jgi:DNA-binding NarL/FixJ family response regulator
MAGGRILLALRDPPVVKMLRDEIALLLPDWRVVGVIDPTVDTDLAGWSNYADVVLIGARELLLLHARKAFDADAISPKANIIVLANESQLLDVVECLKSGMGLVIEGDENNLLAARAELATTGHVTMSAQLLRRLAEDQARLDIVKDLSPTEKKVLKYLGSGMTNRDIARATSMDGGKIKTVVHSIMRKLRMKNRTAVAVFAARKHLS